MPRIEVDVVGDVSSLSRELKKGASQVEGFSRDVSGRMRDSRGRFVASGSDAGGGFLKGMRSTLGGSSGTASVFKGVLGANLISAGVGAAVSSLRSLGGVLKDSVGEARESQKVGATTAQVIKATGGAAKISAGQVGDLATALSNKAGVDDETIQSGANLLLTFKNVRNEAGKGGAVFDRATAAAVDLSATGFGSISGSSKMLGKALNDPVKGISALSRAGVTFTDQQKKQITALTQTGDVLGAQKIILGEVEAQVGGVAAANATAGEKAQVMAGNLKEQLGTALLPTLDKLAGFFTSTLGPAISAGIDQVGPALDKVGGFIGPLVDKVLSIGTALAAGLSGGGAVSGFLAQMQPIGAAVLGIAQTVGPALLGIVGQVTGLAATLLPVITGVASAAAPLIAGVLGQIGGLIQTLLPVLAGVFTQVGAVVQAVLPSIAGVVSSVVGAVQAVIPIVAQVISTVVGAIQANLPLLQGIFASISSTVSSAVSIITSLWSKLGPIILPIVTTVFGTVIGVISGAMRIVSGIFKTVAALLRGDWSGAWNGIKQTVSGAVQVVTSIVRGLAGVLSAIWGGIKSAAGAAWNGIKSALSAAWSAIASTVSSKANELLGTVRGIPGRIRSALGNLGSMLVASGRSLISGLAQGIRDGIGRAIGAAKDAVSAIRDFFPFSPAKRGPFSGRGWTLYSGRSIGAALAKGMGQSEREVVRGADQLAEAAAVRTAVVGARVAVGAVTAGARASATPAPSGAAAAPVGALSDSDVDRLAAAFAGQLKALDPRGMGVLVAAGTSFNRTRGGRS